MSQNIVQFQAGLSMSEFFERYGTEAQCESALTKARWPQGFVCPHCGARSAVSFRSHGNPGWQCRGCDKQTTLTAGTIFHSTKLPLRVWFQAMFVLKQAKNNVAALELKRILGVSYPTAWLKLLSVKVLIMKTYTDSVIFTLLFSSIIFSSITFAKNPAEKQWLPFCTPVTVGGLCDAPPDGMDELTVLHPVSNGYGGYVFSKPIDGHLEAEVQLDLVTAKNGPVALLLIRPGKDGLPDRNAYSGILFSRDQEGFIHYRVVDRQPKVDKNNHCLPITHNNDQVLGDDVWDSSCSVPEAKRNKLFEHVLTGSFEKNNDYKIPFKNTNGKIRVSYDAVAGFYRFSYGVSINVLGETKATEGLMDLAPSPVMPQLFPNKIATHFLAIVTHPSAKQPIELSNVRFRSMPEKDSATADEGFNVKKRPFTWSGYTGEGVVISFAKNAPTAGRKLVFWEHTRNVPVWVMNDQLLLTYEFIELWARDRTQLPGCFEAMSDRLNWRNSVDILEDNAVRKVIRWTYFPMNPAYQSPGGSLNTLPVAVETWSIYPDGTSYRHIKYSPDSGGSAVMDDLFEHSEIMVISGTKFKPRDHSYDEELTLTNLSPSPSLHMMRQQKFIWGKSPMDAWAETIAMVPLRSYPGESEPGPTPYAVWAPPSHATALEISGNADYIFDRTWHNYKTEFTHWPVSRGAFERHDKTFAVFPHGEVAHSSIMSIQTRGGKDPAEKEWVSIVGLTAPKDETAVKNRAATWLRPGPVKTSKGCEFINHDNRQGGMVIQASSKCTLEIMPPVSGNDLINPVIRLQGLHWKTAPQIHLNGQKLNVQDYEFAVLNSGDALLRIDGSFNKTIQITIDR